MEWMSRLGGRGPVAPCLVLGVVACATTDDDAADGPPATLPRPFEACEPVSLPEPLETSGACPFEPGAFPDETLGVPREAVARLPITHVVVRMQENRSFDHYLGRLTALGRTDVDGLPEDAWNPDLDGGRVRSFHLRSTCLEADPPHQWGDNVRQVETAARLGDEMLGFVESAAVRGSDGHYVMGWYDDRDLPLYYWLAEEFALGDRYFSASLGGTWSNRNFLYMASAFGVRSTFDAVIDDRPTLFDQLDAAGVSWGVYTDGSPRQDTIGWSAGSRGVEDFATFLRRLRSGRLERVTFVDTAPWAPEDEHPPNDVQDGEAWLAAIYDAATEGPLWPGLALFLTYDNGGGLFDHVPPPPACVPTEEPGDAVFDRYGPRTPFLVVSPWAKRRHVSHGTHSHTSIVRFIQLLHDLPALTRRDANATGLLDFFDFSCPPPQAVPPRRPEPGYGGCR